MRCFTALLICGVLAPASARARDPDLDASNEDLFVALAAAAALSVFGNMAGGDTRRASGSGRQSKRAKTAKSTAVPTWQPGIANAVATGWFSYHRQGVSIPASSPPPPPLDKLLHNPTIG